MKPMKSQESFDYVVGVDVSKAKLDIALPQGIVVDRKQCEGDSTTGRSHWIRFHHRGDGSYRRLREPTCASTAQACHRVGCGQSASRA